ncbi:MAG: Ig-like domain-containing protein [Armatimonadota bacterium]
MRNVVLLISLTVLVFYPVRVYSTGFATSVYLSANPDAIIADGKSIATIGAEIRDSDGNLVPDGTLVSFSSSLGTIQSSVSTTAGVARARLSGGTVTGTATVSAWVTQGGAVGQVKVELLAPGTEISRQSFVTIASKSYLVYDPAKMVIQASGGATVMHRGLMMNADEIEFDLQAGIIKCRQSAGGKIIKLSRGNKSLQVCALYYRVEDMKGKAIIESETGNMERVSIRGADMAIEPDTDNLSPVIFNFSDISMSDVLMKASSITVRLKDEIHFRHAQVYVDGKKVLSVPLHVLELDSSKSQSSQYVGWGANGLKVDVPLYYSLSPSSTGALHVRRGQQSGWGFYSGNSGWSLDLVQDYTTDTGGEGNLELNGVTSGEWGANWHFNQQYDSGSRVYSYLSFPAHKDLFGMINLSKPLGKSSLGLNIYGNKYQDQKGSVSTDLYLQSQPKPIAGGAANYVLLGRTSYATGNDSSNDGVGAGAQMQVYGKPVTFSKRAGLTNTLTIGQDWGGERSGFSLLGNSSFNYRIGKTSSFGLVYSYTRDPSYSDLSGRHRLSANIMYMPSTLWQARIYSTQMIDTPQSSTFADVSYRLFPTWRINLLQTFQSYDKYDYSDTEIALCKEIQDHEMMLIWSKSRNRFRVEFNVGQF